MAGIGLFWCMHDPNARLQVLRSSDWLSFTTDPFAVAVNSASSTMAIRMLRIAIRHLVTSARRIGGAQRSTADSVSKRRFLSGSSSWCSCTVMWVPTTFSPGGGRATPGIDHGRFAPGSGRPRERDAPCSPGVGHTPGIAPHRGSPGGAHPGERDPPGSPRWGHLGGNFGGETNQNRQNH